jgi:hypothetical protein
METKTLGFKDGIKSPAISTFSSEEIGQIIEIDPKKEAAARRKFDIYVLPVSVIFLVLSSLDRNNVSNISLSNQHHHL